MLSRLRKMKSQSSTKKNRWAKMAGFTLLELIITLAIIGTLMGLIYRFVSSGSDTANLQTTNSKASMIQQKLLQYRLTYSNYPTTEQGLQALTVPSGGVSLITEEDLKDGWNNLFDYRLTSQGPLLISYGKSGDPNANEKICYLNGKKLEGCDSVLNGG